MSDVIIGTSMLGPILPIWLTIGLLTMLSVVVIDYYKGRDFRVSYILPFLVGICLGPITLFLVIIFLIGKFALNISGKLYDLGGVVLIKGRKKD